MIPPPPVTPSPHRFVIKPTPGQRTALPASQPQQQLPTPSIRSAPRTQFQTQQQQFNATPRFNFAVSQSASQRSNAASPLVSYATVAPARYVKGREMIEDAEDESDEYSDERSQHRENLNESIESSQPFRDPDFDFLPEKEDEEGHYDLHARNPKRRRISSSSPMVDFPSAPEDPGVGQHHDWETEMEILDHEELSRLKHGNENGGNLPKPTTDFEELLSSADTEVSIPSPQATQHHPSRQSTAPRFIVPSVPLPGGAIPSTPQTTTAGHQNTPFIKPPRFRPPAADEESATNQADPLPDAFSPQRRGQKFMPGGLANEVVGWVMSLEGSVCATASAAATLSASSSFGFRDKGERWLARIVIDEIRGGAGAGMTLVKGRRVTSGDVNVNERDWTLRAILAGSGVADTFGRGGDRVEVGKVVGIKGPIWEVVIEDEQWGVVVTWDVLG